MPSSKGYQSTLLAVILLACRSNGGESLQANPDIAPAPVEPVSKLPKKPHTKQVEKQADVSTLSAATPYLLQQTCEPCRFVAAAGRQFDIHGSLDKSRTGERGLTIRSSSGTAGEPSRRPQKLMSQEALSDAPRWIFEALDVDFDGVLDLVVGAALGIANLHQEVWRLRPDGQFENVGSFVNLRIDVARQELIGREKGGHGGALYQEKTYAWSDGALVLRQTVEQVVAGAGYLRRTTTHRKGGKNRVVEKRVAAPGNASL